MEITSADLFTNALFGKRDRREILVTFTDGESVIFTDDIFDLLKDSPDVENIADAATGEILFHR